MHVLWAILGKSEQLLTAAGWWREEVCSMLHINKQEMIGKEFGLAHRTQCMKYLPEHNREFTSYC